MYIIDLLFLAAILTGSGWLVGRSIRSKRELMALRDEKNRRRQERGIKQDEPVDLLFLLDDTEKKSLLRNSGPLPEWLGKKQLSDLSPYEAAWYAGYARHKMSIRRYLALIMAAFGGVFISKFLFTLYDKNTAFAQSEAQNKPVHILPSLLESFTLLGYALPFMVGIGLIAWSFFLKEKSDDFEFYADALEEKAKGETG